MTYRINDSVRIVRPTNGFKWCNLYHDGRIGIITVVDDIDNSVVVHFGDYESAWFLMSEVERIPDNPANGTTVQSAIDFLIGQGYDVTISKKAN